MQRHRNFSEKMKIHVGVAPPDYKLGRLVVLLPCRNSGEDNSHEPWFVDTLPMAADVIFFHLQKHPDDVLVRKEKGYDMLPLMMFHWLEFLMIGAPWNAEMHSCLEYPLPEIWGKAAMH